MKQLIAFETNSVKKGCSLSKELFRLDQEINMSFEHNSVRKNLLLSAGFCCVSRLSSPEVDQKFISGGTIGYGDSYLEYIICRSKVFRLYALLHDAAEAVRFNSSSGLA